MTDPPITQHGDGVLIRGPALPLLYRACFAMALRLHRDGLASPPLLTEAIRVLYRACTVSQTRHPLDTTAPTPASWPGQHGDWISIAEAAALLGIGKRQTQRLASGLDGVRCGSICGRTASSSGKPCRVTVRTYGDACPTHAAIESETTTA